MRYEEVAGSMQMLNDILHELGISKVKLARFLGVSRQMVYNYLELGDINKWPKDKKVLLLNLLGIKTVEEIEDLKIDTDYIMSVENRLNSLCDANHMDHNERMNIYHGLGKKQADLLHNIIDFMKEHLEDDQSGEGYHTYLYLYHFMQAMESSDELKYILGYVAKSTGFVKPMEYVFDEEEQFALESLMFSAMTSYHNYHKYRSGGRNVSQTKANEIKAKLAEAHRRFVNQIEQKQEERMSRTLELNTIKIQALKELGYTEINEKNASEVFEKIAEIQSRKVYD